MQNLLAADNTTYLQTKRNFTQIKRDGVTDECQCKHNQKQISVWKSYRLPMRFLGIDNRTINACSSHVV